MASLRQCQIWNDIGYLYEQRESIRRCSRNRIKNLNSINPEGFSYDTNIKQESLLKNGVETMQSVNSFLDGWGNLFNKVSGLNGYGTKYFNYPMIIGSRGCAVCHEILEKLLVVWIKIPNIYKWKVAQIADY